MLFPTTCVSCGRTGPQVCAACCRAVQPVVHQPAVAGVDRCRVGFVYGGPMVDIVRAVKYRNGRRLIGWLADLLAPLVESDAVLTWVPTTPERRGHRGFDQSRLLANAIARRAGAHSRRLLVRVDSRPQTGRSRQQRLVGPEFRCRGRLPERVVIVDDVVTTGTTLERAGAVLRQAGVADVEAIAVAFTPRQRATTGRELRVAPIIGQWK